MKSPVLWVGNPSGTVASEVDTQVSEAETEADPVTTFTVLTVLVIALFKTV